MDIQKRIVAVIIFLILIADIISPIITLGQSSDSLELKEGTYVRATYFDEITNLTLVKQECSVSKIWNISGTKEAVAIKQTKEYPEGLEYNLLGNKYQEISITSLVWKDNRSVILPNVQMQLSNQSYSVKLNLLYLEDITQIQDVNSTQITINEDSPVIYNDLQLDNPKFEEIQKWMDFWQISKSILSLQDYGYTWLAINPEVDEGRPIKIRNSTTEVKEFTKVKVGRRKVQTIHIKQEGEEISPGIAVNEYDLYYERKTGFLIKYIEKDFYTGETFIFEPTEINIEQQLNTTLLILSIVLAGITLILIILRIRRRR